MRSQCLKSVETHQLLIFLHEPSQKKTICAAYQLFSQDRPDPCLQLAAKWSSTLAKEVTPTMLDEAFSTLKDAAWSINLRLQQFKTVCMLYYTPDKIVRWGKQEFIT